MKKWLIFFGLIVLVLFFGPIGLMVAAGFGIYFAASKIAGMSSSSSSNDYFKFS
jgi:threonine dehydrogenase-like Zn-dependent dehydrogenase